MQTTDAYAQLRQTLARQRPVDEKTRQSVVLLTERLEQLKREHPMLSQVGFSPEMQQLAEQTGAVLVS